MTEMGKVGHYRPNADGKLELIDEREFPYDIGSFTLDPPIQLETGDALGILPPYRYTGFTVQAPATRPTTINTITAAGELPHPAPRFGPIPGASYWASLENPADDPEEP